MQTKISQLDVNQKFLLGFSGGVDSSALFFMLLSEGVEFDIAIVDYGVREQSKEEVAYAKKLGELYAKEVYILNSPAIQQNFEAQAREVRYNFFTSIVERYGYAGVILAHQLNDRLEWFLMQLCKGSGLNTLLGFGFVEKRGILKVYRPLLEVSKQELYAYCLQNQIKFFEDSSNDSLAHTRNFYRQFTQYLGINELRGIKKSLKFLREEHEIIYPYQTSCKLGSILFFKKSQNGSRADMHYLDQEIKKLGYVLSQSQRDQIFKCQFSCEICGLIIESNNHFIFLCKKVTLKLHQDFRDFARRLKIPLRIRRALYADLIDQKLTKNTIKNFFENDQR